MHKPHSAGSSNPWDDSAHPLTDDQAMAQVVEPAKQIVAAADLQAVRAGFSFTSCNDQGDPPYQGTVRMAFLLQGDHDAYFQHVRAAMLSHGWIDGPTGTVLPRHNPAQERSDREHELSVGPQLRRDDP